MRRPTATENGWEERVFSTHYACPDCKTNLAEIEPRTFSFNSPYGACPDVRRAWRRARGSMPELVLPDLSAVARGRRGRAVARGGGPTRKKQQDKLLGAFLAQAKLDWETPLDEWPDEGARATACTATAASFPGVLAHLEMDFADATRESDRAASSPMFRGPVAVPRLRRLAAAARGAFLPAGRAGDSRDHGAADRSRAASSFAG